MFHIPTNNMPSVWDDPLLRFSFSFPQLIMRVESFHGDSVVKSLPANAGDAGSISGPGGSQLARSD